MTTIDQREVDTQAATTADRTGLVLMALALAVVVASAVMSVADLFTR